MTEVKSGSYIAQLEKELEKNKQALDIAIEGLKIAGDFACHCCDSSEEVKKHGEEIIKKINEVCK